jgi:acyl-CoA dehydrogenase
MSDHDPQISLPGINFALPDSLIALRDRVRAFVNDKIVPYERDPRVTAHGPSNELRQELVDVARSAGMLSIQTPRAFGGMGLSHIETAVVLEASGWSPLGPVAMNCAAPDEGNMAMLAKVATPAQQEQWLKPLVNGEFRSVFAMTEPGGAGADPNQLATTAVPDGDDFVINGRKWLITGADGAGIWIIMAKVVNPGGPEGATLFLVPAGHPGIIIERIMNTMDRNFVGGHGVVLFKDLRVPKAWLFGDVGAAFRLAQVRLGPARLTHCMRWLGAATRAHHIAIDYARSRTAFGKPIGEHQGVGFMLADNETALKYCRLVIWHTAWLLDQGERAAQETSMSKAWISEELYKVADRCVQILGGMGISDETVVEWIFRDMRAFRIYDGPTEVHKFSIARQLLKSGTGMLA